MATNQNTKRKDKARVVLRKGESQRKDGKYDFRWTSPDGKRHSIYAATLEELREKENDIQRDSLEGIKAEARYVTLNDVFTLWAKAKRGLKDNTFQNYLYLYRQFVEPDFGKSKVSALKKSDVKQFYNTLADERGLQISTIDSVHTVLHQVLDMAVDDCYLRSNPSDNVLRELKKAHQFETNRRKALTVAEQNLLLSYLSKTPKYQHWYPIFAVMLGTGLRVGEATGLRWCDVDFEEGTISVNHTLVNYDHRENNGGKKGCYFNCHSPKTKAGVRTVPMMDFVKEAFEKERAYQEEAEIRCTVTVDGYTDFIFVNRFGECQHQGTARYHELGYSIKASEKRLAEIAALKAHIINYAKTRPVYDAYCKTGYSKRFLETHRTEITLHKAAKAAFDEADLKKLPKVKELDAEYSKLLTEKKARYPDYRKAKEEMQELLRAKRNVELFFAEEKSSTEKTKSR